MTRTFAAAVVFVACGVVIVGRGQEPPRVPPAPAQGETAAVRPVDRQRAQALLDSGYALLTAKVYEQAERELAQAVDLGPPVVAGRAKFFLGKLYEEMGKEDAALEAYLASAQLGIWGDSAAALNAAYRKKHGSTADLEATIDRMARARPRLFDPGRYERPKGDAPARVALMEIFIDAHGTSVVSELTYEGLVARYDRTAVAALQYEVNLGSMPNPLANDDAMERVGYYGVTGTPAARLDGSPLSTRINSINQFESPMVFAGLTREVESRLARVPQATVELSATRSGQQVSASARASLVQAEGAKAGKPVLRVVLAQDEVRHTGFNSVRFHSFVVRKVLTPAGGVPLDGPEARAAYTGSVNVTALNRSLQSYLASWVMNHPAAPRSVSLAEGTLPFDAAKLVVVAFVQDEQTKEILQAAFIKPA